jgi:hypothetical protein
MALIKEIDTDYGIPANYWNIGAVQEDFKGKGTEVTLPVQTVLLCTSSSNNGPNLTVLWTFNGGLTACYWSDMNDLQIDMRGKVEALQAELFKETSWHRPALLPSRSTTALPRPTCP